MKAGVIVGRFQVPYLHPGHLHLIATVLRECDFVIILLGTSKEANYKNPYSVTQRVEMIQKIFPQVHIKPLPDQDSDEEWSQQVDLSIAYVYDMEEIYLSDTTLYHSRDSFVNAYSGKYPTKEIPELPGFSGTQLRNELKNKTNV